MSKINLCFKRIFVFFNVLFAILGALILGLGLLAHIQLHGAGGNKLTGVIVLVVIGLVIFILSVLGAYGAQKENRNVLIAFFVIMCMGTIALFRMAVQIAISREQVISTIQKEFQKLGPLDQADPDIKNNMELLQPNAKCCGLFNGYQDWGNEVPASCNCEDTKHDPCQVYSSDENRSVYSQPCGPIIQEYLNTALNITLGAFIGFGVLSLLAAVMSLVMIIRITAPTVSPPAIFDLNYKPPKYSELVPSA